MKILIPMLFSALLLLSSTVFAGVININTADAYTLARELNGVGQSRATAIIEYRDKNGPFKSIDDLTAVKGIGNRTLEKNRSKLSIK